MPRGKKVACKESSGKRLQYLTRHSDDDKCKRSWLTGQKGREMQALEYIIPLMWYLIWSKIADQNNPQDTCTNSFMENIFECNFKEIADAHQ